LARSRPQGQPICGKMTPPMTHPASGEPLDLSQARRIVVKLGTQLLMGEDGFLAFARLAAFVEDCLGLLRAGKELLIVTSGAVGLGRQSLKLFGPLTLNQKQACASVGQSVLMDTYRELFGRYGYNTGQILVTAEDFANRQHYLNLQKTLETLLEMRVVPVINENDTVATAELQEDSQTRAFGDNDKLSALVAGKLPAGDPHQRGRPVHGQPFQKPASRTHSAN
jgi:glutamate 5-kinase